MTDDSEHRVDHGIRHEAMQGRDWWEIITAVGTLVLVVLAILGLMTALGA